MARNTLLDLSLAYASKGTQAIIDSMVKSSAFLRTAGIEFANNGFKHTFPVVTDLPGVNVRGLNEGTVPTKGKKRLDEISLKIFESKQSEDYLMCDNYPGGTAQFFADNAPLYTEALVQAFVNNAIYGTTALGNTKGFKGIHQYVKDNATTQRKQLGGASGASTSIIAVRWKPGVCGLVVPTYQGKNLDQMLKVKVLNGGNPISIPSDTTTGEEMTVYQAVYNALMGLMCGSVYSMGAICQIDSTHKPTATNMNNLVDSVRSQPGDGFTFIYASRIGQSYIADLKDSKYYIVGQDKNYDNIVEFWRGVPIMVEDNILNTETNAID